ncbi:hypothetical protein [Streptomyces acidicola]|uniref:Uncharacterized protein n=1 Tax=Streptomyces acidicola TaxID=2596892 RepID=A0A5N8X1Q4_9ACTN|nr:hypothetical protein [Streptomyces acidicola]MPY52768.1 hypothetical protein [Streptomyces acidicola]
MPVAVVRAGLFSVLGAAVAGTVHHLAFDSGPSWGVRVLAALILFGIALPGAGHDKPLVRQLVLAAVAQAGVGYWFVRTDGAVQVPAQEAWPSSAHAGWPVVVAHVLLTVLGALLLHGMDTCRRRVLCAAGRALLRRLFTPVCAPLDLTVVAAAGQRADHGDDRAPEAVAILADALVRRGPPLFSLSLAV